jgi:hypothetical protein
LLDLGTGRGIIAITLSIDVGAPKPIADAWRIDSGAANSKGVFSIGDEINLTETLD